MKSKFGIAFLIFSLSLMPCLSALNLQIIPTLGYTNYFSKKNYEVNIGSPELQKKLMHKNIELSACSIGLDIVIIDDSQFTFFFNNHVSFLENSRGYGNFDIVRGYGSSVVEEVLYDASSTIGYTFLIGNFRLGIGSGLGIFGGANAFQETSPIAMGFVTNINIDYFLIQAFALSFGIEDGIYGSLKRKKEALNMYNRLCARIGCVINF